MMMEEADEEDTDEDDELGEEVQNVLADRSGKNRKKKAARSQGMDEDMELKQMLKESMRSGELRGSDMAMMMMEIVILVRHLT